MRSGTKLLRIGSILQIVLGIGSIVLARFLLGADDPATGAGLEGAAAVGLLFATYGGYAFQILAGLLGLALANKKSVLTIILGVLLFIPTLITFLHTDGDIVLIVVNAVCLLIPYLYLHGAWKNFKA